MCSMSRAPAAEPVSPCNSLDHSHGSEQKDIIITRSEYLEVLGFSQMFRADMVLSINVNQCC